jgi:hypothetical protein
MLPQTGNVVKEQVSMAITMKLYVSRRLPTSEARVRARVRSCGICGRRKVTGAGVLRVLRFTLPLIPPIAPHSLSISWAGTIGQQGTL